MMNKKNLAWLSMLGFGLALTYAVSNYPQQRKVAPVETSRVQKTNQAKVESPAPLPIEKFTTAEPGYAGFKTDLFRPLFKRPPARRKPKPKRAVVKRKTRPLPPPAPSLPVVLPKPPMAKRLASFTYFGQAKEGKQRSIFLKEKERLFVVKVGEDFGKDREFHLVQVTDREIRIETGEPVQTIHIPLQKKQSLRMKTAVRSSTKSPLGT